MSLQPLGQTFKIDSQGGCFITSVQLYFAYKDEASPVWVELRNVVAGAPGQRVLPHSRKVLEPSLVQTNSTDGTTPTKFLFDSPIYVQEGQEYAIVILTKSQNYRIWTAQMGEIDVYSGGVVASQPALGVLYKSSNGSSWTPTQNEDLKFTLNRAFFSTRTRAEPILMNDVIGTPITYPVSYAQ